MFLKTACCRKHNYFTHWSISVSFFQTRQVETDTEKLKEYWSNADRIIQAGYKTHYVLRFTHLLILLGIRKNCHIIGENLLLYPFIKLKIKVISNHRGISLLSTIYILSNNLTKLRPHSNEITGNHVANFVAKDKLLLFCKGQILEKNGRWTCGLWLVACEKYIVLLHLIKTCLNETNNKDHSLGKKFISCASYSEWSDRRI